MAYSTINKPTDYFITHLYTGNDTTNNQSVGLTPDLVWVKARNSGVPSHYIVDKVRGDRKYISSNSSAAEATDTNAFDLVSGGFDLDGGNGWTNLTGRTYASWNWKADNTSGSSNTDGSITSNVAANPTAGFSIVNWTGTTNATIGHGLGQKPAMVICKSTDNTAPWLVWHKGLTGGNEEDRFIILNSTDAGQVYGSGDYWGTGGFTSTVFGTNLNTLNNNLGDMIAYCFAEVKGYSKMGSYTANNSNDGVFLYLGFRPAFLIVKCITSATTESWQLVDSVRSTYNVNNARLFPNLTSAESTGTDACDFLSNGVKIRNNTGGWNEGTREYIYMAFAEQTLVGTNNVCSVAR